MLFKREHLEAAKRYIIPILSTLFAVAVFFQSFNLLMAAMAWVIVYAILRWPVAFLLGIVFAWAVGG